MEKSEGKGKGGREDHEKAVEGSKDLKRTRGKCLWWEGKKLPCLTVFKHNASTFDKRVERSRTL